MHQDTEKGVPCSFREFEESSVNLESQPETASVRVCIFQWIPTPDPGCALPELGPTRRDDCPEGWKRDTHKRDLAHLPRVNGNFIKLKSGIYTSGLEGPKMQGLLPTRSRRRRLKLPGPSGRVS